MVCEESGGAREASGGSGARVIACVASKDAAYARSFCEQLGFRIVRDDDLELVFDANGARMSITKVNHR